MSELLVREAMLRDPLTLDVGATAQDAARHLSDPDVRAVLVCSDDRLAGVVTRKTLVREVVAKGLDPAATRLGEIAEPPLYTIGVDTELEQAFHDLEQRDLERVPVTDGEGRLAGVLSRAVVQRRLAEEEPAD